jgi:hypothetical protein
MTQMIDGHARRQGLILSGVGHWVNYEAVEPVNILLKDWFKAGKIAHTV